MRSNLQTISLSGRRKKKLEKQVEKNLNALRNNKTDYKLRIELGDSYALLEQVGNSVKHYYAAIDLLRQSPNLGKVKNLLIELYEKIIRIAPDETRAYMDLSEDYIAAGQKEKAFRFLLSSAKKAYENENYELALQCYNQAIAKGRTNPHIVERCTEIYLKLGRKEEAMQNYLHIGDMYAQEEKNIEALEYYKKACALDKDNPELVLKVARMYNAMAWTENAASELVKVGEYYEHQRNFTEALRYYRYSVRLDPENDKAQDGKKRISESYTAEGIPISDSDEIQAEMAQDVLEELDRIEDFIELDSDQANQGEFEVTPIEDLGDKLTIEDDAIIEGNSSQVDLSESEDMPIDLNATLTFDGDKDMEMDSGQVIQPEPEAAQSDQDNVFAIEADEDLEAFSPDEEESSSASSIPVEEEESSSASSISLEDWIIDLREGELVELALEDALKDQEMDIADADLDQILDIAGDQDQGGVQETLILPLPEATEPTDDAETIIVEEQEVENPEIEPEQILNIYYEEGQDTSAVQEDAGSFFQVDDEQPDSAEMVMPEDQDMDTSDAELEQFFNASPVEEQDTNVDQEDADLFFQVDEEQPDSAETVIPEDQDMETSDAELDQFLNTSLDEEQDASVAQEDASESFLQVDEEQTGDDEIVFKIEVPEDPLQENNGKGPSLSEFERAETQVFEFPGELTNLDDQADQPAQEQSEEEQVVEFLEDGIGIDEQPDQMSSEEEQMIGFDEDFSGIDDQLEQEQSEEEQVVQFLEDTADIDDQFNQIQVEEEQVLGFDEDIPEIDEQFSEIHSESNTVKLQHKIEDLEQQLQRTEEEKYFLQERFAAQIGRHKSHEESLQREIADVYRDKEELERQLQHGGKTRKPVRKSYERFDEARYEELVAKIQHKKALLQKHLGTLLEKRDKNGRFLKEGLNTLNETKKRLQSNLEYFQQIKARVEEKIDTELTQARLEIQSLSQTTQYLETKLQAQQQVEQDLRKQFKVISSEKEKLKGQYTESINNLNREKALLKKQLQQASRAKKVVEKTLREKLQGLHRSYQHLKIEYKTALESKEVQINESAQQLSEFADKYVKLERALSSIRRERDRLNTMLTQETMTRESLEGKLIDIESQVDSLEIKGTKLLKQLGHELDRHFSMEQNVSDKFQLSLDELEDLLLLQEKEIHDLEAL